MNRSINKKENLSRNPWAMITAEFPKEKNGVIYVRQSSIMQVQTNVHSFEMQTDKFLEHFRNMGCTGYIEIITDDEAMSGTLEIHKRPGMARLMRLIQQLELLRGEPIGWAAAVDVNRFTRDPWLITPGVLMKTCYEHNVWIATLRMHFNFQDPYCQRVFMIAAEEAARHLEWMKLVLGGARSVASDNGYYDGRYIVPGYIVDRTDIKRKRFVVYEPHAQVIFWLFRRFLELDGNFPALCREVDALLYTFPKFEGWVDRKTIAKFSLHWEGNMTPEGHYKVFRHGLRSILTNPVYLGWWIPLDGGVIKENHEPIVEEPLFVYAHKRLATFTLEGERQLPERVTRHAAVPALLQKVLKDRDGTPIYAARAYGGLYQCIECKGHILPRTRFVIYINYIDRIFLEKFFERLRNWHGCDDWEDTYLAQRAEKEKVRKKREHLIKRQIQVAAEKMQEILDTVALPRCPASMKDKLFKDYEGLEKKKAELEQELHRDAESQEDDDEILFQIYTLLPAIMERWEEIPFDKRMRFVGALVDKVLLSLEAPSWMRMEIQWKRHDWESDVAYIRRRSNGERWNQEEVEVLRANYLTAETIELLQILPTRSWSAMKQYANRRLGMVREKGNNTHLEEYGMDTHLCWQDLQFMREQGIASSTKIVQWFARMANFGKTGEYREMLLVISSLFDQTPPPQTGQRNNETEASSGINIPLVSCLRSCGDCATS